MMINSAMNSALYGMQTASAMFNSAASNIANLSSAGSSSSAIDPGSSSGSIDDAIDSLATDSYEGSIDPYGGDDPDEGPANDLAGDIVQLSNAQTLYDANAFVIRTSQQMTGSLLDMFDNENQEYAGG